MFIANSFHDECRYSSNKLRVIILDYSFNALQRWIVNKKSTLMYNLRNNCFQNKRNVVLLDNFCVGTRLLLISIERFISLRQSCHIEYHNILDEDISRGNQMKWLSFKWQKISICVQIFDFFYFALSLWSTKLSSVQTWFWWDFDCSFFQNGFVVCLCWELLLLVIDQTTPNIKFNDLHWNNFSSNWKHV